jgi:predicted RNA-binding Zn ribbon-like protein
MFKRATWLGVGFTLGVGTTVVAARKARQQLDRYKPPALVDRVTTTITDKATNLRVQVTTALDDGKQAAREREDELRSTRPKLQSVDTDPTPGKRA